MAIYNPKSLKAEEFINHEEIEASLKYADENKDNFKLIDEIIEKAKLRKGISHREASVLLACEDEEKPPSRSKRTFTVTESLCSRRSTSLTTA